jgi:hypothetical protein
MKMRIDLVLERKTDTLRRLFAVIAIYASDVSEMRLARANEPGVGRMWLNLEGLGTPRDLLTALLHEPSVREASVTRELAGSDMEDFI